MSNVHDLRPNPGVYCDFYHLVGTGFLQSIHHDLKLQRFELHLAVESVEERLVLRVHVVVGLLIVQAER